MLRNRTVARVLLLLAPLVCSGCGQRLALPDGSAWLSKLTGRDIVRNSSEQPPRPPALAAPAATRPEEINGQSPTAVVDAFLAAVVAGRADLASSLLTSAAQRSAQQQQLDLRLPGAPTASFHVGSTELLAGSPPGAHVECTWSDAVSTRQRFVTVLEHEPVGWRIAGMVTLDDAGQPTEIVEFRYPASLTP